MVRSFKAPIWATLLTYLSSVGARAYPQDASSSNGTMGTASFGGGSSATYDYIIVGGGLTGLVAASRLSENNKASVLVLEYGPIDRSNKTLVPYYATSLNTADLFNITSAPEPYLGGATYMMLAGSVAGGGSTVNGMELDRASAADYDSWEQLGNPGWGWDGLFPYFKKSTQLTPPPDYAVKKYGYTWDLSAYGKSAPLQAAYPDFQYPDMFHFSDGLDEMGIPFIKEHAAGNAVGHYWTPESANPKNYTRSSSLTAYFDTSSNRRNLKMLNNYQVTEVLFSGDSLTAAGVRATDRTTGKVYSFSVNKEVILAAGAFHTPQILMLSGIGPKAALSSAGIKTKLDLPAVGTNFQDHPTAYLQWNVTATFPNPNSLAENATFNAISQAQYIANHTGPYTKAQAQMGGWLSLKMITKNYNNLISSLAAQKSTSYLPAAYSTDKGLQKGFEAQRKIIVDQMRAGTVASLEFPFSGAGFVPNALEKPLSRGTITLNPANPYGEPVVTNYAFQNPFDKDQLYASVQWTRKFFQTKAMSVMNPVEVIPGVQAQTEEDIFAVLAASTLTPTFAHPSCSCPMMPKAMGGCVSSDLLVYGTKKLSIIDASIMPIIPAAHLQAGMYAIAEKAADIIKSRA